ncbi:UDP-glucose 4-epimerase [Clostridia bacterium]|nr:UDP-glucose 4-epimerase [Clostridia bacterium]
MKRILITGANSYIGTSFEKWVGQYPDKYSVETLDMIDGSWRNRDFSGFDVVFHVAGIAHADVGKVSDQEKTLYYKVNCDLAKETALKAKSDGVRQFIFMSSIIVYGDGCRVITRDTVPTPANFYGDSKLKAEVALTGLVDHDFKVAIIRPPMIYGKGSKGNYSTLVKIALKLPVFPDIDNERSMLYIDNLCEFIRIVVDEEDNGTFFPQNAEYVKTAEMIRLIVSAHKKKIVTVHFMNWAVKLLGYVPGKIGMMINKAFGNLVYEKSMSKYKEDYHVCNLSESIRATELGNTTL